jgi:hypothetical protein
MRKLLTCACWTLILSLRANSQADVPKFAVEVRHTFVWGEDAPAGAVSSQIRDPLTGAELRRLKHTGVEVTSRIGFEKLHHEDVSEFIVYSSTIINNTDTELAIESGGIAVDGRLVLPLSVDSNVRAAKQRHSKSGKDAVDIRHLHCFGSGYLSGENFLSQQGNPSTMLVGPQRSLTVSGIIKDPRYYPLLCSVGGCFPKGTIRYSIRVGGHEYMFSWNGGSIVNCGK